MKCTNFNPMDKNTLRGFATIELGSGMVIKDCSLHESNGQRWVSPPGKPKIGADGQPVKGQNGKALYINVVDFVDKKTRDNWSVQAVRAIEAFIGVESGGGDAPF